MNTTPAAEHPPAAPPETRIRMGAELLIAITLIVAAGYELWSMKEIPQWMPLALLAAALFIYTLRGRALSEGAVGKDGISWKLEKLEKRTEAVEQKTEAVGQQAEQATQAVAQTKEIVAQVTPKPSARRAKAEKKLRSAWDHPGLRRKRVDPADPEKGQWGGLAERNDRKLSAKVKATDDEDWFSVNLEVRSTDPDKPLVKPVRFHLHDTFNPSVIMQAPKDNVAKLHKYAVGGFTVGAEVQEEPGTYLELDLAELPNVPQQFRDN